MELTYFPVNVSVQCVVDFSYDYVQREALKVPLIFKEMDGLGIR